jgi:hypothetical protein
MLVTSGDIYIALVTGGLTAAFMGVGLVAAASPRLRVSGGGLLAAGIGTILSPMFGVVAVLARLLPSG